MMVCVPYSNKIQSTDLYLHDKYILLNTTFISKYCMYLVNNSYYSFLFNLRYCTNNKYIIIRVVKINK